jgi:phosphoglycerate dehydrogenase-like enzyme
LIHALNSGKIAGSALDTFCQEPLPKDHPFWKMKNVIVTPHVGGMSDVYVEQALSIFEENLRRYLKGERQNLINLVTGTCPTSPALPACGRQVGGVKGHNIK